MIYLDSAATTKVDYEVVNEIKTVLEQDYGNPSSIHSLGLTAEKRIKAASQNINKLFGEDHNIIFTASGTESNNLALFGLDIDKLITTKIEHPSVLEPAKELASLGRHVVFLDVDKEGFVNLEQLKTEVTENTNLVSIIHANNEIGTIQDINSIIDIVKKKNPNTLIHIDATQSFTKVKIPNADMITISAHKIHGPKGIGALVVKKGIKLKPLFYGGAQQKNIRSGTENVPGIIGFAKAVELDADCDYILELQEYLISKLEGVKLIGPKDRLCNNINILMEKVEAEIMLHHLEQDNIYVSTGSACSASKKESSHVLRAIGLSDKEAKRSLRISLSRYNTKEDIDIFIEKFNEYYKELKDL